MFFYLKIQLINAYILYAKIRHVLIINYDCSMNDFLKNKKSKLVSFICFVGVLTVCLKT